MKEKYKLLLMVLIFLIIYFLPFEDIVRQKFLLEGFLMLQDYARNHVLLCLVPAFFIAGAISAFISQESVIKYLGPKANKILSYSVASISGTILSVCSCTVLPIFAGIYTRGAGLGPAIAFLYSGPAINVLAIILTTRILGFQIGVARAIGAIVFSIVIGLIMSFIFTRNKKLEDENDFMIETSSQQRPLWKTILYFLNLILILIFATWGKPSQPVAFYEFVYKIHWYVVVVLLISLFLMLNSSWFEKYEITIWVDSTWKFAKQIFPLLLVGVFVAGLLMGRPGTGNGLIPSKYIITLVGGNSLRANLFSSISATLMYFATLTEIPILQSLLGNGMGKGPALTLLLAGPALSLPSMIVLSKIIGIKKTFTYIVLVVVMSTIMGIIFGNIS